MPHANPNRRSVDAGRYSIVPRVDIPRSAFDVRHGHKTTFNADKLIPVWVDEVMPGDSIRLKMTALCRLAPALVPPMDNLILESFFFFVPNRLLWTHWENFMGGTVPGETTVYLLPRVGPLDETMVVPGSLWDYLGVTVNEDAAASVQVNALPSRAYALIWNEWFRDQDLQAPAPFDTDDGPDDPADYGYLNRGKRYDYFTAARPWPQKPMNIEDFGVVDGPQRHGGRYLNPLAGVPVVGLAVHDSAVPLTSGTEFVETGRPGNEQAWAEYFDSNSADFYMKAGPGGSPDVRVLINDIRTANMVQLLLERNARGGTRYAELVRSHFGVVSPDARLQRPEYLGGGRTFINFAAISQTSASAEATAEFDVSDTKLGEQAGQGTAVAMGHGFSQSFTEHGIVIGMVNVRSDLSYQNGTPRMFYRRTQFDFYWPALAHLGEQAIVQREIYSVGAAVDDTTIFGYIPRWDEYRSKPSRVSGYFRSSSSVPLDMWHFAQEFGSAPSLNSSFISSGVPVGRVLQSGSWSGMDFLADTLFEVRYVRPMPMFSIPGMGPRL